MEGIHILRFEISVKVLLRIFLSVHVLRVKRFFIEHMKTRYIAKARTTFGFAGWVGERLDRVIHEIKMFFTF